MERHHTKDKQNLSCAGVVEEEKIPQEIIPPVKQTAKGGIFKNSSKSVKR